MPRPSWSKSPVASSAKNLSVEEQVTVLKDAFVVRLGRNVPSDHAALAWLVEFAAVLINRYEVGRAAQREVIKAIKARVRGAAALQEVPGGTTDGKPRRQLAGRGILGGTNRRAANLSWRPGAEDEDRAQASRGAAMDQLETEPERRPRRRGDASDRHADGRAGGGDQEAGVLRG